MSMLQIEPYLVPRPEIAMLPEHLQPPSEHYFIYGNHYSISEFKKLFPAATYESLVSLPGWQWHINERGLSNLRLAYSRAGNPLSSDMYLLPPPMETPTQDHPTFVRAYGYLVTLPKESDALLHTYMTKQGYHRISQFVNATHQSLDPFGQPAQVQTRLKVAVFIDVKFTRDLNPEIKLLEKAEQRAWWLRGLHEMQQEGAPRWYAERIWEKLLRKNVQVEPIFIKRDLDFVHLYEQQWFEEDSRALNACFEEENKLVDEDMLAKARQKDLAEENRRRDRARQIREKERHDKRLQVGEPIKTPVGKKQSVVGEGDEYSIASRLSSLTRSAKNKRKVEFDVSLKEDEGTNRSDKDERMQVD